VIDKAKEKRKGRKKEKKINKRRKAVWNFL